MSLSLVYESPRILDTRADSRHRPVGAVCASTAEAEVRGTGNSRDQTWLNQRPSVG